MPGHPASYNEVLRLWFEFMKLAINPKDTKVLRVLKDWDPLVWAYISPLRSESFTKWKARCRRELDRGQTLPVEQLFVYEELMEGDMLVRIDTSYSKEEVLTDMDKLLKRRLNRRRGKENKVRKVADFQPNAIFSVPALQKTLNVWVEFETCTQAKKKGKNRFSGLELGTEILGLQLRNTSNGSNEQSIRADVSRRLREARALIVGVRQGQFPDPNKPANGNEK